MIKIIRKRGDHKDFRRLVRLLDDELNLRYGNDQVQYDKYNKTGASDTVVIAYLDNVPAGCACFRKYNQDTVEIKRMMVKPEYRGSDIAKMILLELETWAREEGFSGSILETGIKQRYYQNSSDEKDNNPDFHFSDIFFYSIV